MPVYKYKTFEEADRALWNFSPDRKYFKKISELFKFADKLNRIKYPRGVFKFKTLDEANRHREKIELKHAKKRSAKMKKAD